MTIADVIDPQSLRVIQGTLNIAMLLWAVVGFGFAADCYRDLRHHWRKKR